MEIDLAKLTVPDLLRLWADSMAELRSRDLIRTGNNPVGDLAEAIAYAHYGGERGSFSQKGWDIRTPEGERIQVKGMRRTPNNKRSNLSAIRDTDYDTLLAVIFDENFNLADAFTMPRQAVEAAFPHRAYINGIIPRLSKSLMTSGQIARIDLQPAYDRISRPRKQFDSYQEPPGV
ncbi:MULTISPECIES: DUF6998 domain-containing protein [Nocardia]|uniref:DUF6998 domain-containing protein n=1 Tax=Nocardia TaxID=1817 RepID=UPI0018934313|nr:hypothetical protein [Nocardia nova]MBF6145480.1 hypothetical protein [Nocardia nova]